MTSSLHQILVVGVGSIGERHVRCLQATRRAQVSICDTNDTQLNTIAQRYDIRTAFSDFDEALDHTFAAVVIATPAHLHVPMAIQAATLAPWNWSLLWECWIESNSSRTLWC